MMQNISRRSTEFLKQSTYIVFKIPITPGAVAVTQLLVAPAA